MRQGVTRWDKKRNVDLYRQSNMPTHCSSNQHEQTLMVWPCREERGRVNAEGCNEVKDEGKETKRKTKTKVAI